MEVVTMVRKLFWATGILVVLGLLTFGSDLWSYLRTGADWVTSSIRGQVPLQFEVQRAEDLIADLTPEIQANMDAIAEEEVAIKRMREEAALLEDRLEVQRNQMGTLRDAMATDRAVFVFASRTYGRDAVRNDLGRRVTAYKQAAVELETQQRILAAREQSLAAAQTKLHNMFEAKRELEAQVAELKAELTMAQAVESAGKVNVDDSKLAQARQSLESLRHRLEVFRAKIHRQGLLTEGIQLETPASQTDVMAEVDAILAQPVEVSVRD
jgi:phage shock protein A